MLARRNRGSIMAALVMAVLGAVGTREAAGQPITREAVGQPTARPWLGVELDDAPRPERGVRVRHAVRSSPAWNAGVRDGDVIVLVEQAPVARPEDVIHAVGLMRPGATLRVSLLRSGAEVPLRAILAPLPDPDEMLRIDKVGTRAPTFSGLSAVSGTLPVSADLRGRVVIVDFWATWCMACRLSAPKLSAWQAKFGAQGLSVVGITEDAVEDAARGMTSFGIKYASVASDPTLSTVRAFGVRALPTVYIVDKRGVVRDVVVGFERRRELETERLIERLLAEPAP